MLSPSASFVRPVAAASLMWLATHSLAQAQTQPSPPPAPAPVEPSAPASSAAPAGFESGTFQPAPSPLLVPSSPAGSVTPTAPGDPSGAPAPVYPPSYPPPQPPGQYGTYAPPPGYPLAPGYAEAAARPGAREHDGFFLRLKAGLGAGGLRYDELVDGQQESQVKSRGLTGAFEIAIGGTVAPNLVLHGNASLAVMDSRRKIDGADEPNYDDITSTVFLFGGGATYYLDPTNLYFTLVLGTVGIAEERRYDGPYDVTDRLTSGAGFGSTLSVGKEWWVGSGQWGLGIDLTGGFYAAPVEVTGVSSTLIGHTVTLSFVATYN